MEPCSSRDEFLAMLINQNNPAPLLQFPARACIGEELPKFSLNYPAGDVAVYPGFIAFLTTVVARPGWGLAVETVAELFQDRLMQNAALSVQLAHFGGKLISELKVDNKLKAALSSPNSLYIPFQSVVDAKSHPGSFNWAHRIEVVLCEKSLFLCENRQVEPQIIWWNP